METIGLVIAIVLVVMNAFALGEELPLEMPRRFKKLDRKPFNCRPCLTFHLHWIGMAIVALVVQNGWVALVGIVTALGTFLMIKSIEAKKIDW